MFFVDDTKIYKSICNQEYSEILQQNVDAFIVWCVKNGLERNTKKYFSIRFGRSHRPNALCSIKGQALELVYHIKDLSIIFNSKLSFKEHIEYLEIKEKNLFSKKVFLGNFQVFLHSGHYISPMYIL